MLKYLITTPNNDIRTNIIHTIENGNIAFFNARAAKLAKSSDESKTLNLTPEKPTSETASIQTTQCRIIAGNHKTNEVMNALTKSDIIIIEPESAKIIADMFPEITFDIILPFKDQEEIQNDPRYDIMSKIGNAKQNFPENLTGTLLVQIDQHQYTAENLIDYLMRRKTQYKNIKILTQRFVDLGLLTETDENHVLIDSYDKQGNKNKQFQLSKNAFTTVQIDDDTKLNQMLATWLTFEQLDRKNAPQKPKIILLGRTGSGKTTIMNEIINKSNDMTRQPLTPLKTVTTRPQRNENDTAYHFITKEQADTIQPESKYLRTFIGEHEYFARKEDIDKADIMVLDPSGLNDVMDLYPETPMFICYVKPTRKLLDSELKNRNQTRENYEKRYQDENETFTKFEKDIEHFMEIYTNAPEGSIISEYTNDFDIDALKAFSGRYLQVYQGFKNVQCLYSLMGIATGMPPATTEQINGGSANLVMNANHMSDFMVSLTMTLDNLPIDWSFKPGPFKS